MQALRADLAAAERDARSAPRPPSAPHAEASAPQAPEAASTPHPASQPPRQQDASDASHPAAQAAARMAIHDIDLALTDFRQQVRDAARADRGERMSTAKAASARLELEAALLRIKSVLGS
jgi:hypothetical protein